MRSFKLQRQTGEVFARARRGAGMTQKELAHRAKTRQANISRLERGIQNPSVDFLYRVAAALGKKIVMKLK